MRKLFRVGSIWMLGAAALAVVLSANQREAEARPIYPAIFAKQYPKLIDQVKEAKCTVCHPAEDNEKKKLRNNYGMALGKALGTENEKDREKVAEMMMKIEKEPSAIKEKTFGDLIKEGKLPASTE